MRPSTVTVAFSSLLVAASSTPIAPQASATVSAGDPAPNFTKDVLGGGTYMLEDELGPVIVIFLFGYNCPVCIGDAPDFEDDVQQHYLATAPGDVAVIGADLWDGSAAQVQSFRNQTGVTFPLLLKGSQAAGGSLSSLYGPFDNYVVIDQGGVVRYHAAETYSHGNRYHPDEIRAAVDAALAAVAVGDGAPPPVTGLSLMSAPSPFSALTSVTLDNVSGSAVTADVNVYDATGRLVVPLFHGAVPEGATAFRWDGRTNDGYPAAPGVYYVRARAGALEASQRVVLLR